MTDICDPEIFSRVWARVTEANGPEPAPAAPKLRKPEAVTVINRSEKSKAVRFIPEM